MRAIGCGTRQRAWLSTLFAASHMRGGSAAWRAIWKYAAWGTS